VQAEKKAKQPPYASAGVTMASRTAAKIALFRKLFRGREDVLPRRWEHSKTGKAGYAPMCRNEWVRGVCAKPQVRCKECPNQAFIPLGDDILRSHLAGKAAGSAADFTVGVYPMLPDETCWFFAADFDKKSWMQDVAAFRDATRTKGHPCRHRAIALGQRCARLDFLRRTGAGGGRQTSRYASGYGDNGSLPRYRFRLI
jgi:hypothetical protein